MSLDARLVLALGTLSLDAAIVAESGETVALVGPNGAGKTTVVRALAGLEPLQGGHVTLDGVVLEDPETGTFVPPEQRSVGVVFQDSVLFPHLSARENVAFGLRSQGLTRRDARRRADAALARLGLAALAAAKPAALSGGQAQRVALARALAIEPQMLLLDEPLASLDAEARREVRRALRRDLGAFAGPRVLVTHDALDAALLADSVVVLEEGRVVQTGTLAEVTARPRSRYVAELVGVNLLRGRAAGDHVTVDGGVAVHVAQRCDGEVLIVIHPHAVALHRRAPEGSPRNAWPGRVDGIEPMGDRVRVRVTGALPLVAEITPAAVTALSLAEGVEVWATVKATEITVDAA